MKRIKECCFSETSRKNDAFTTDNMSLKRKLFRHTLRNVILLLFLCYLLLYLYLPKNNSYHLRVTEHKSLVFTSTNYTEENGTFIVKGYFEDEHFGNIETLMVKNITKWFRRKSLQHMQRYTEDTRKEKTLAPMSKKITSCRGFNSYKYINQQTNKESFQDWKLFEQNRVVKAVNCKFIFENNTHEINRTLNILNKVPFAEVPPSEYINRTKDCATYIRQTGYITSPLTDEEEQFPIAYSLLVFKGVQQVERLLRAIYRPQNVYCIHVDKKSEDDFRDAIHSIARCFENVFISSTSFSVVWGSIGVILPEIECMSQLWKHKKWKYFINLTGQEFPLRTNLELVKILKAYNGANDLEGTVKRANKQRWEKAGVPPHGIQPVKGSVHIVVNRGYVDYILHNNITKDFLNWTRNTLIPDETFFSSLNHNPHLNIKGAYKGVPETDCDTKPFLARFKNWGNFIYNWPCHGTRVRLVCVFGVGDLPLLSSRQELFANKFYLHYQTYALQCMDELIFNRTRDEYFQSLAFDTKHYESLPFIKDTI